MSDITKSDILNSLKKVDNPQFRKELLILNSIKNIETKGKNLLVDVVLPSSLSEVNDDLKKDFVKVIKNDFPEIKNVELNIETKVSTHKDNKKESLLPDVKNTIAVASGKGGVGKSMVATNLAVALAKDGAKVGLIDADIYGPSIPLMLGIKDKPKVYQNQQTMKIIPLESFGIKLISIGVLVDDNAPVIWRGPMASGAVKQFMTDVDWGELDYLIFDMPPGTGDIQLTLVQTIPLTGAVIVTTPQEVSLIDARKALKMFTRVNVPVLGVIENMSYFIAPDTGKKYDIFGTGGGENFAKEFNTHFLGSIPIEPKITIGGDKGIPIVFDTPELEHAKIVMNVAKNLAQQVHLRNLTANSKIEILLDNEE
ncbi:MAG: iron-sulfur cluster carrier protein ApbC [Ignavibacteriaceae bacterium]